MDQVLERPVAAEAVPQIEATLNYLINTGEKIVTEAGPGGKVDIRNGKPDPRKVVLHNGRPFAKDFKLEREGFRFVPHDTKVADFFDDAEVRRTFYPEMEALVKAESGARRVVIFDHTLRTADDAAPSSAKSAKWCRACTTIIPNGRRHSGCATFFRTKQRSCSSAGSPSSRCGGQSDFRSKVFRWRSAMRGASPTTIWWFRSGATSIASAKPTPSPSTQITNGSGFRACAATKRLSSKCSNSEKDGRARWTAHTAFDDPTSPPNARPRESIEIRTLAFF